MFLGDTNHHQAPLVPGYPWGAEGEQKEAEPEVHSWWLEVQHGSFVKKRCVRCGDIIIQYYYYLLLLLLLYKVYGITLYISYGMIMIHYDNTWIKMIQHVQLYMWSSSYMCHFWFEVSGGSAQQLPASSGPSRRGSWSRWLGALGPLVPSHTPCICLVGGLEHGCYDFLYIIHILGMSSSQLTNSYFFQRGRYTTSQITNQFLRFTLR